MVRSKEVEPCLILGTLLCAKTLKKVGPCRTYDVERTRNPGPDSRALHECKAVGLAVSIERAKHLFVIHPVNIW